MKLVLFSDPHITADALIHGRQPVEWLDRALAHARENHADADACLFLGDLTNAGRVADYATLRDRLSGFPLPCHFLIGNHDDRQAFLTVFPETPVTTDGFVQSTFDVGTWRAILLDTHVPQSGGGSLDSGRLAWLDRTLADADRPCLIFLHHPPIDTALPAFETIGLADRAALAATLAAHRDTVAALFFGHCHMSVSGMIAGLPAFGLRSLIYQALPNFADRRFIDAPGLPPAYGVVMATETGLTLHTVEFGYDGTAVPSKSEP